MNLTTFPAALQRDVFCSIALLLLSTQLALAAQTLFIDPNSSAKQFDGIGAVSGGGATSVLLKDYPEPQRSQILDLLFKPKFGASMSALFVEIPGDGNSTQGSELSHMHSRDVENYQRGYEWWLMREAKRRNPALTLDGVAWSCPGWVGNGHFPTQDMCDYYVKWIKGLKRVYGLDLDAIGCRNERGVYVDFVKRLRRTLNTNGLDHVRIHAFDNWGEKKWDWCAQLQTDAELREAVDIIGNHTMSEVPTPPAIKALAEHLNKPIWNTEEHVYRQGFDCELSLVKVFNENFISNGVTKIVCWYLLSAFYPIEPYYDVTVLTASSPWSGHYTVNPALWAYAHYGQFCDVGWKYLPGACTNLAGGGSLVTLSSAANFSIIAETKDARTNQTISFILAASLTTNSVCVWRSNEKEQFVRLNDIAPAQRRFSIELEPDSIYSVSTTTGQQKGAFGNIPGAAPFPLPYRETFDGYTNPEWWGYLPRFTADICGGYELANRPDGGGKCLRQVISARAQNWAPEWMPYTILGDRNWQDYEISADVLLEQGGWAGIMGRISDTGNGWGCNPKGYYLRLSSAGELALFVSNNSTNGAPGTQLAAARLPDFSATQWHNLKLRFSGINLIAFVNHQQVLTAQDLNFSRGMTGLVTGEEEKARYTASFDNLIINQVDGDLPPATIPGKEFVPMYHPGGNRTDISAPASRIVSSDDSSASIVKRPSAAARLAAQRLSRFTTGSMAVKQAWDLASAAINSGDFHAALSTLENLNSETSLTAAQRQAVDETITAVRAELK